MTANDEYRTKCEQHREKCAQHLHRIRLAWLLASTALESGAGFLAANQQLVGRALGAPLPDPPNLDARQVLAPVVAKTHFLLLKVEFEFFLQRMTHCLWEHHFEAVLRRATARTVGQPKAFSAKHSLKDVADAVAGGRAKEFVLHKVVPAHGLGAFEHLLEASAGVSLPGLFQDEDPCCWCQIRTAFKIRNQIEHENGKVNEHFVSEAMSQKDWKKSSWESYSLSVGDKIPIREEDFAATFSAMERATDVIAEKIRSFPL